MVRKKESRDNSEDDITFEDDGAYAGGTEILSKIEKLKKELKACRAERQEYLDGWQRLRAGTPG